MKRLVELFKKLAIKKKILGTNFATCTLVLFVACTAFVANEALSVKSLLKKDLATQAEVIARNCSAAVSFNDSVAAAETINSLQYKPNILDAYILAEGNRILASYHNKEKPRGERTPAGGTIAAAGAGSLLGEETLAGLLDHYQGTRQAVVVDGEIIGTVVLLSDLSPFYDRLYSYGRTAAMVMFLALALAYLFSTRLAELISRPILHLAGTMSKVSVEKNYALRAPKANDDEVGTLIDQFNSMLGSIEERDELLREHSERLQQLAHYDALTGLPNRLLIIDRLDQAITHAAAIGEKVAVMFIDLDHFKDINDSLGHRVGDLLLTQVAGRLRESIRGSDNVGRLGGDEFVIFLSESKVIDNVVIMIQRIVDSFNKPFLLEGTEVFVTASIGATFFPLDGETVDDLLKNADTAMYAVKEKGKNHYQFFSSEMQLRASKRLELHNGLRRALENSEFFLVYQPIVSLESAGICGFEALLRWRCPERGIVPPLEFIPLAEETGLIVPIGEWVVREVCRQLRRWQDEGLQPLRVSVNVSPVQFRKQNLAERVLAVLEETAIDPSLLGIEITESFLLNASDEVIEGLWTLKRKGIRILIDDFGTGYSSLGYLRRIPLDALKVDRSFIANSLQNHEDETITKAILGLGNNLTLRVIGEGVETEAQLEFLRGHGCHEVQGYLFSRPILPDECHQLLVDASQGQPAMRAALA
jgi:diguanylate cyclase (GGDEF)-like protein